MRDDEGLNQPADLYDLSGLTFTSISGWHDPYLFIKNLLYMALLTGSIHINPVWELVTAQVGDRGLYHLTGIMTSPVMGIPSEETMKSWLWPNCWGCKPDGLDSWHDRCRNRRWQWMGHNCGHPKSPLFATHFSSLSSIYRTRFLTDGYWTTNEYEYDSFPIHPPQSCGIAIHCQVQMMTTMRNPCWGTIPIWVWVNTY